MAAVSTEFEIVTSTPADKVFKSILNFHTLAPKAAPEVYKSITVVEGDGGVGTVQSHVYGEAVPYTSAKQKIDAIDATNFSAVVTIFEGDVLSDYLDSVTHHIKISPTADGGASYKHTTTFNCKGEKKPTEEDFKQANEGYKHVFKAVEAYLEANPDAC